MASDTSRIKALEEQIRRLEEERDAAVAQLRSSWQAQAEKGDELRRSRQRVCEAESLSHDGASEWDVASDRWIVSDEWYTRSEHARRESETKYRSLFNNIGQGFCIMEILFDENGRGIDHRFLETNPAFERHTSLVDAVGKTARQLVPEMKILQTCQRPPLHRARPKFLLSHQSISSM